MRRKFAAVFLSTVFLITGVLLTGCGSSQTTSSSSDSSQRTITIATSANPRPYTYQDADGNLTGYDIDLTNALFEYLPQYNVQYELTDIDSCLTGLTSGRYQIVANNLGYKDERAELYIYQGPLNKNTSVIALRKGLTISSMLDLAGYVTEAEPQIADTGYLETFFENHAELSKSNIHYTEKQPAQQYQDLNDGTVDFLFSSIESYEAYTEEFGYTDLSYYTISDSEMDELKEGLALPYFYYCLGSDETQLAQDLTDAMKQYKESGKWSELAIQYFGQDVSPDLDEINYWDSVQR